MGTKANLVVDQGATFSAELALVDENGDPINLDGYEVSATMKKWYTSLNLAATFGSTVDEVAGTITLTLTASQTAGLTAGRYVYNVELVAGAVVSRVLEGIVTVTPQV